MARMWMIRAETGGRLYEDFKAKSAVAIGWHEVGNLENHKKREDIAELVAANWPEMHIQWQRQPKPYEQGTKKPRPQFASYASVKVVAGSPPKARQLLTCSFWAKANRR